MAEPKHNKGRSKQDYNTPDDFLEAVRRKFGPLVFDLAATARNAVCSDFYTEQDNSLTQPWGPLGGNGWCNPPFSNIAVWVEKAYKETLIEDIEVSTLMLLPAGVGSNWWRRCVHGKCKVYLLNGRLTFKGASSCYPKDCVLLHYRTGCWVKDYEVWTWPTR